MTTSFEKALELHRAHGMPAAVAPENLTQERRRLRLTLLGEEVAELVGAMVGLTDGYLQQLKDDLIKRFLHEEAAHYYLPYVNLPAIAQEACDVHAVVSGTLVEYGLPEDAVYDVVHAANMAKVAPEGGERLGRKLVKPPGWRPPDVVGAIGAAR